MESWKKIGGLLVGGLLACGACQTPRNGPARQGNLEGEFASPPPDSKMASYWWIFGPAWTKEEIDRELKVLQAAGIGRLLIFPLYPYEVDSPARGIRNQKYLSPEFLDTLSHAVKKANELSVEVDLVMGTGWPYGGPMVPQTLSPRRIYARSTPVTTAGGSRVTLSLPDLGEYEELIAVLLVPKDPSGGESVDLTGSVQGGRVSLSVPLKGRWEVMTFIQGLTQRRHKVIFAAAGAGGNSIDHLDKRAVEMYLREVGEKLASVAEKGQVRAMYSASFEVYGSTWTPGFLAEFQKRRGYDLAPHLSALVRDEGEKSLHIRHDYWQTIGEVAADHFLKTVGDWCRTKGFAFQIESYGVPPVTLGSFAAVDYPMGEDYNWKEFNRVRWAASASHYYGQKEVSVEAYTWLRMIRYSETLEDVKLASDLHFLSGANRIVAHGYAYSPPVAGIPGWGYYAGAMFTENNTWWPYFPKLSEYIHRVSHVLGLGVPVAKVAIYLPAPDLMAEMPAEPLPSQRDFFNLAKEVLFRLDRSRTMADYGWGLEKHLSQRADIIESIITNGYSLDGIDHSILSTAKSSIEGGSLRVGDSNFSMLVLPGINGLPLEDLEKIVAFARAGGTVITTLHFPKVAYGFRNRQENAKRFQLLVEELYGGMKETAPYQEKAVGRGRSIIAEDETSNFVRALRTVPPDLEILGDEKDVGFVHRQDGQRDFYFVANISDQQKDLRLSFGVGNRKPRLWDPMTGEIREADGYEYANNRTNLGLALEPYGSAIIEFGSDTSMPPSKRAVEELVALPPIQVQGPWKVDWEKSQLKPRTLDKLVSWTAFPDLRCFSGAGSYEAEVALPPEYFNRRAKLALDLGIVKETAEVWINGQSAGVAWKRPHVLDVTGLLRPGQNHLRIDVTNLLINLVLCQPAKDFSDVEAQYPEVGEVQDNGTRLPRPREKEVAKGPFDSGLLGPVVIRQVPAWAPGTIHRKKSPR